MHEDVRNIRRHWRWSLKPLFAHWPVRMRMFTLCDYFCDGMLSSNNFFKIQTQLVISMQKDPLSITPHSLSLLLSPSS